MTKFEAARALAHMILVNAVQYEWTLQGFGLLRLHMGDNFRLHVWDDRYRYPGVSTIHDHLQWGLESMVLAGSLINHEYETVEVPPAGKFMMRQKIKPGFGTEFKGQAEPVSLRMVCSLFYGPGRSYSQRPGEIHETDAARGTVTLIRKYPTGDESANVFWLRGGQWGTAEPRTATKDEVATITRTSLDTWFKD